MHPPHAIPIKERGSHVYLKYGRLDVRDGAFVLEDSTGVRTQIPVGGLACVMLGPGTTVTHDAVALAARVSCLLMWVGEEGVRLYSSGRSGGARADNILRQAAAFLDHHARLRIVRTMFALRFKEDAPDRRGVQQLRGIEGARVRAIYGNLAKLHGIEWKGRNYDPKDWGEADVANRAISVATSCLYGISEAAILAAGYSPAIGFLHTGKPLSFVYDIADVVKFDTVVPLAFGTVAKMRNAPFKEMETAVRHACRDSFRKTRLMQDLVPLIDRIIDAAEMPSPDTLDPEGWG